MTRIVASKILHEGGIELVGPHAPPGQVAYDPDEPASHDPEYYRAEDLPPDGNEIHGHETVKTGECVEHNDLLLCVRVLH